MNKRAGFAGLVPASNSKDNKETNMIQILTLALALLLGGANTTTTTTSTTEPSTTTTSSEDTTPPDESEARSHIVDIG